MGVSTRITRRSYSDYVYPAGSSLAKAFLIYFKITNPKAKYRGYKKKSYNLCSFTLSFILLSPSQSNCKRSLLLYFHGLPLPYNNRHLQSSH